jgi:hypothetical protein
MRLTIIVTFVTLFAVEPVFGQTSATVQYPYGLDPYKPSDAELLRRYGSVLTAQTPLSELRKLDPYKPSEIALLRDLGAGIPVWAVWYPSVVSASVIPYPTGFPIPANITILVGQLPAAEALTSAEPTGASPQPSPTSAVTILRPETNDGLWISFAGKTWISSGPAVAFQDSQFTRVGEYGAFPVFRRHADDVIYLPTRQGLVAPYRLKR